MQVAGNCTSSSAVYKNFNLLSSGCSGLPVSISGKGDYLSIQTAYNASTEGDATVVQSNLSLVLPEIFLCTCQNQ